MDPIKVVVEGHDYWCFDNVACTDPITTTRYFVTNDGSVVPCDAETEDGFWSLTEVIRLADWRPEPAFWSTFDTTDSEIICELICRGLLPKSKADRWFKTMLTVLGVANVRLEKTGLTMFETLSQGYSTQ